MTTETAHTRIPTCASLIASFARHLRQENKAQKTVETYCEAVRLFSAFLQRKRMPEPISAIHREHIESFIVEILEKSRSTTARNRYASLQQFFRWAREEGEIYESPMIHMRPPKVELAKVPVLTDAQLTALLNTCRKGTEFQSRRDYALIRVFMTTGCRRAEVAGMRLQDVDLDGGSIEVTGKGRKIRPVPILLNTITALDRYLRRRSEHKSWKSELLWLGRSQPLNHWGIEAIVRRRAKQADIGRIHLHQFRHTWTSSALADSTMPESDLMALAGWESRQMLERYGREARQTRAVESGRRLTLDKRL